MSKSKTHGPLDTRVLQSEIKRLKKTIKQLEKTNLVKPQRTETKPAKPAKPKEIVCTECGKGEIRTVDLGIKMMDVCSVCEYKKLRNA